MFESKRCSADLLAKSAANKERHNKERLDSYYRYWHHTAVLHGSQRCRMHVNDAGSGCCRRNYQDYFNFQRGAMEQGRMRSISPELQAEILEWLRKNDGK